MKSAAKLKHCMLYLIAYFLLQESKHKLDGQTAAEKLIVRAAFGTFGNMIGLLQNE